jgi:hypothetical protein
MSDMAGILTTDYTDGHGFFIREFLGGNAPPGRPFLRVYSLVGTRGPRVRSGGGRLGRVK